MVYEKKKSGDPDYDDKVPMEDQTGKIVTAGDGRQVIMTDNVGPVDAVTGEHVNLDDPLGEAEDNRPAPGEVATEHSTAQTYTAEDTPMADNNLGEVTSLEDAQNKAGGQTTDTGSDQAAREAEVREAEAQQVGKKGRK